MQDFTERPHCGHHHILECQSVECERAAQLLGDLHEALNLRRLPAREEMQRTVNEAGRRAESAMRLEHALLRLRLRLP